MAKKSKEGFVDDSMTFMSWSRVERFPDMLFSAAALENFAYVMERVLEGDFILCISYDVQ